MTLMRASLSEASLLALAARLDGAAGRLDEACDAASGRLAEIAAQTAKAACPQGTDSLARSIGTEGLGGGRADAVCSAPYAAFVEFGTGLGSPSGRRQDNAAMADSGYRINASGKGESGWAFPSEVGWKWTHGQSGKGFMAAGAEEARDRSREVVRDAVRAVMS